MTSRAPSTSNDRGSGRRNFWLDGGDPPALSPPSQTHFDAVVVGAGFTGLWSAWHLLTRMPSASILVLDQNAVGSGASSRNAGYLVPHFSSSYTELARTLDHSSAAALAQAGYENLAEVIRLVKSLAIGCDLEEVDIVTMSLHPGFDRRIARDFAATQQLGVPHLPLASADLRRLCGACTMSSGYSTRGAAVNPAKLVRGLAHVLDSRGVRFLEHTRPRRFSS